MGSSNLKVRAIIITANRVWVFSDNLGIGFSGFDLWDIPTQFLEGHFLFIILMSFSCAAQYFKGGKGVGGKTEIRLPLQEIQLAQRYRCWVKLLEEDTLWKPITQLHISANHCLVSRGIFWVWSWLLDITNYTGEKEPLFWDFCQYSFMGWHTECWNFNI